MNYKYIITISMENKKMQGKLQILKKGQTIPETYIFCPTNVLCDLTIMKKNHYFKDDKSIEYIKYKYENAFGEPIHINKSENMYYYYPLAELIKKCIVNNSHPTISEMEKYKMFFNISYSVSIKEENELYGKFKNVKNKFKYTPVQYGTFDIENLFKDYENESIQIYQCNTLTEVIFSIWYYLISNKYNKTRKCNHCEKWYFYSHSNNKYCSRKSPIKNYEHLECEQAVRNIVQLFNRRNRKILLTLKDVYPYNLNKYKNLWNKYKAQVDKEANVNNIMLLAKLTSKKYVKEYFYKNN